MILEKYDAYGEFRFDFTNGITSDNQAIHTFSAPSPPHRPTYNASLGQLHFSEVRDLLSRGQLVQALQVLFLLLFFSSRLDYVSTLLQNLRGSFFPNGNAIDMPVEHAREVLRLAGIIQGALKNFPASVRFFQEAVGITPLQPPSEASLKLRCGFAR